MLVGYITMLPDDYENLAESVIATNGFGNNILAAITTKNYWDISNEYSPLMHTWYVGVIMQFYVVFPILFYLARLDKRNPKGLLLTIIVTLAVISLLVYFATTDTAQRFYYLPSRFFEFAVGGIAALLYNPQEDKPFGKGFAYVYYILLLALMFVNADIIPATIRLVAVVGLSCVLLCSQDVLENKVTGSAIISKIGAASYSIFIWHQVILAFYRYTTTSKFLIGSYAILLIATVILSWLSYHFIEQGVTRALQTKRGKIALYAISATVFVVLNVFAGIIYLRAGVVRDVPELYISKNNIHRGMHAEYVDRGYQYDKDFTTTDKKHWYVIGNSFGRDFVNIILESPVADQVEVSYSTDEQFRKEMNRFKNADMVFLSTLGLTEKFVREVEVLCLANDLSSNQLVIVGEKNFGESNGQIYARRNKNDYFEQYVEVENKKQFIDNNHLFSELYGDRYIDLMKEVLNSQKRVMVFTPDHHFMSADCRHLSEGGAKFFASRIRWDKYLSDKTIN
jgi:peptidoglycan/LPS O-acetylase OafA/YrhL